MKPYHSIIKDIAKCWKPEYAESFDALIERMSLAHGWDANHVKNVLVRYLGMKGLYEPY